jgi:type I restriction enzyme, S subunit
MEFSRIRKRCDPNIGDVLLSCSGSVGRAALVDKDNQYVMVRSAAMIRPKKSVLNSQFLMYALQSPILQIQIAEKSSSTAQANIFLGSIKSLVTPLPPIPEQLEIVRRVEKLFAFADQLEKRIQTSQATLERLTPSILAKAFRGDLVPQDPTDEPASVLLERIQATRAEEAAVPKQRKPRQVKVKSVKTGGDTMKRLEEILSDHLKTTLQELNPNGQTSEAKALWQASELSIDEFYLQLSREISAGLLRMNEDQPSIVEAA